MKKTSDDVVGIKLKNGIIKLGKKVLINGREHVALEENGVTTLVHRSSEGDYYET